MKKNNGNNIFKKFLQSITLAKDAAEEITSVINSALSKSIDIVRNSNNITEVLTNELIILQNFDINIHNNNENKIENRVILCNTAIEEYELFNTDKEKYLEKTYKRNMFSSKEIDINKDTLFEQSVKKLIINLGNEKNSFTVSAQTFELCEVRQNKLKQICKEFSQERKAFLSKHIKQEQKQEKNNKKQNYLEL